MRRMIWILALAVMAAPAPAQDPPPLPIPPSTSDDDLPVVTDAPESARTRDRDESEEEREEPEGAFGALEAELERHEEAVERLERGLERLASAVREARTDDDRKAAEKKLRASLSKFFDEERRLVLLEIKLFPFRRKEMKERLEELKEDDARQKLIAERYLEETESEEEEIDLEVPPAKPVPSDLDSLEEERERLDEKFDAAVERTRTSAKARPELVALLARLHDLDAALLKHEYEGLDEEKADMKEYLEELTDEKDELIEERYEELVEGEEEEEGEEGPRGEPSQEGPALTGKPHIDMDYGPTLSASIEVAPGNIAYKGIAVRLDDGPGGISAGQAFAVFETDTLRWAAGWTGRGFIDWRSIVYDGSHQTHPKLVGDRVFTNPVAPGWGKPANGSFDDPRMRGRDDKPYGPLPREWARWKGLYLHGDTVVLSYRIGDTDVLESPSLENGNVFVRTLRVGPRSKDLIVQVLHESGAAAAPRSKRLTIKPSNKFNFTSRDYTFTARVKPTEGGSLIAHAPAQGPWRPNGKTLFIRDGRLVFDVGWVGAVQSERRIRAGKWHDVAMTWEHQTGRIRFYVDGKAAGDSDDTLKPKGDPKGFVVHFGYTSSNFPGGNLNTFHGEYEEARIFDRALTADEIASVKNTKKGLLGRWVPGEVKQEASTGVSVSTTLKGAEWITADGHRRLKIPAGKDPRVFKILVGSGEVKSTADPVDPTPLTKGGKARWTETVETKPTTRGAATDPYVVDVLTVPMKNPYRSFMRLGGFDFFKDASRAAVCTWMGDVWIVDGLGGDALKWRRIATGMFQPLGVKIVDELIYVTCRDQITRLHDLNGDGMVDFYESFNHDHQVTEHFHEFAMGLQTDPEGNFYYAKSARHAKDSLIPHHGTLIKVARDGSKSEIVCNGFRAANGVGFGPEGEIAVSDQQGHWTPANRINIIQPGGFYGNMYSYHRGDKPTAFDPPTVWLPQKFDRSPAEQLWVPDDRWGPFKDRMLSLSYGTGRILHVMYEKTGGVTQGAAFKFPWDFPTGTMRGRFHPGDGQFYLCGLFGWAGDKTRPGGFYRIRYTGKPVRMPLAHRVRKDGIDLTFTCAMDKAQAEDPDRYLVKRWNYKWAARYGSAHYSVENPGRRGEDPVEITGAKLLDDGRTVRLTIKDFKPAMQMELRYSLKAADGERLRQTVYSTINKVPR